MHTQIRTPLRPCRARAYRGDQAALTHLPKALSSPRSLATQLHPSPHVISRANASERVTLGEATKDRRRAEREETAQEKWVERRKKSKGKKTRRQTKRTRRGRKREGGGAERKKKEKKRKMSKWGNPRGCDLCRTGVPTLTAGQKNRNKTRIVGRCTGEEERGEREAIFAPDFRVCEGVRDAFAVPAVPFFGGAFDVRAVPFFGAR